MLIALLLYTFLTNCVTRYSQSLNRSNRCDVTPIALHSLCCSSQYHSTKHEHWILYVECWLLYVVSAIVHLWIVATFLYSLPPGTFINDHCRINNLFNTQPYEPTIWYEPTILTPPHNKTFKIYFWNQHCIQTVKWWKAT